MTTKEKLLALLEDSKGTFFSGEEIARTLQSPVQPCGRQ